MAELLLYVLAVAMLAALVTSLGRFALPLVPLDSLATYFFFLPRSYSHALLRIGYMYSSLKEFWCLIFGNML